LTPYERWTLRHGISSHGLRPGELKIVPFKGMVIIITLGTLFEQTWISFPQGCSMLNIKTFWPVVHEKKIFEDLSNFSLFCPLLGQPLYLNKIWIPIPQACFLPRLVEINLMVLEKKSFKGKSWRRTDGRQTTDAAPWHKLSWPSARWAKKTLTSSENK